MKCCNVYMNHCNVRLKPLASLLLAVAGLTSSVYADCSVELKVKNQYLNIPVSHSAPHIRMTMSSPGLDTLPFEIRLSNGEPDYWVFRDISVLKGKTIKLHTPADNANLNAVYQADTICGDNMIYREPNRPQYHFTTKRGWLNDPNGLVFYDGEYHLFYQHDPFDRDGIHKHWGHAVSPDLLHWTELPTAISPDSDGDIWSGTAVIDFGNTSSFGTPNNPPMVAAYTVDNGRTETQFIAYSTDRGRTFTKYDANPVVASNDRWGTIHTRDPKLFRYADSHWVMVLCERDGHSIYTSPDLKNWTYKSHTTGFWECPELFQLPVDGNPDNTLWVMYGASGTYMLGTFDGETFTPSAGKYKNSGGAIYAAQTFNCIPEADGRRIQIGWGRIGIPDAPFNQMMLIPTELTLATTKDGVRLINRPVREIENICTPLISRAGLTCDQANDLLNQYAETDGLRIKANIHLSHATDASLHYGGQRIIDYDLNGTAINGHFYSPQDPTDMNLDVEIFIDRGVAEVFIDGGLFSDSMGLNPFVENPKFELRGNNISVGNLDIYNIDSTWPK